MLRCRNNRETPIPTRPALRGGCWWLAAIALLGSLGCSSIPGLGPNPLDIADRAAERKEQLVQQYQQKRDSALFDAAATRWRLGDAEGSLELLAQLLEQAPTHVEARLMLADILTESGETDEARAEIQTALTSHPNHPSALHAMGLMLEASGSLAEAITHYQRAVEIEPENEVYRHSCQEAMEMMRHTSGTRTPGVALAADQLGPRAEHAEPIRHDRADYVTRADAAQGAGQRALPDGLRAAIAEGRREAAVLSLRAELQGEPRPTDLALSAVFCALRCNQPSLAEALLTEIIATCPISAEVHRTRGLVLHRLGRDDEARQALEAALSLDNTDPLAYLLMGYSFQRLGQKEAAHDCFTQAYRLDPSLVSPR